MSQKTVALDSSYVRGYWNSALSYCFLHESDASLKAQQQRIALLLNQTDQETSSVNNFFLANAYFESGDLVASRQINLEVINSLEGIKEPTHWQTTFLHLAYKELGWIALLSGQYKEAKVWFNKPLSSTVFADQEVKGACYLGLALIGQKTKDKSRVGEYYDKAIERYPLQFLIRDGLFLAGGVWPCSGNRGII